jgi:hypothetical protein
MADFNLDCGVDGLDYDEVRNYEDYRGVMVVGDVDV